MRLLNNGVSTLSDTKLEYFVNLPEIPYEYTKEYELTKSWEYLRYIGKMYHGIPNPRAVDWEFVSNHILYYDIPFIVMYRKKLNWDSIFRQIQYQLDLNKGKESKLKFTTIVFKATIEKKRQIEVDYPYLNYKQISSNYSPYATVPYFIESTEFFKLFKKEYKKFQNRPQSMKSLHSTTKGIIKFVKKIIK